MIPGSSPIGLLGGTFDPVHIGHLRMAVECLNRLHLAEVRLLPVGQPVHRATPKADNADRLAMLELAIAGEQLLQVDKRETQRARPSYTVETLENLRTELGPDRSLAWIVGMDAFLGLPSWYRWTELLDLAHLVVVMRPGYTIDLDAAPQLDEWVEQRGTDQPQVLQEAPHGRILFLSLPQLDISSSAIRRLRQHGNSIRYLTPDAVVNYIEERQLYR